MANEPDQTYSGLMMTDNESEKCKMVCDGHVGVVPEECEQLWSSAGVTTHNSILPARQKQKPMTSFQRGISAERAAVHPKSR